jgi:flagellar protein FlgJ
MINGPSRPVYTDFGALAELRANARENPDTALQEVARQFESIYLKMMLKSMREASFGDPLFDSQGGEVYRDMFDNQLALQMSQGKGLGLAEMLVKQLRQGMATQDKPPLASTAAKSDAGDAQLFVSPDVFVQQLMPEAEQAARELGTTPQVLLAQAALETGWGKHLMHTADGSNSYNLFNIKADAAWEGKRTVVDSVEYQQGVATTQSAAFRAYDSYAESFQDYVNFIKTNPRYQDAVAHADDAQQYMNKVHDAGYATDPAYADKWLQILQQRFSGNAGDDAADNA